MKYITVTLMLFMSFPVFANTGFPMIFNTLPLMIIALVPLVLFEGVIVAKVVQISFTASVKVMAVANIITTLVGIPLSSLIVYIIAYAGYAIGLNPYADAGSIQSTVLKATFMNWWFDPVQYIKGPEGNFTFPNEPTWYWLLAILFALLVNYLVSWYLEYLYMKKKFGNLDSSIRKAALVSNALSYLSITAISLVFYAVT